MKTYLLSLTEEEAHVLGSALIRATADARKNNENEKAAKIAEVYLKLDTCQEVSK